VDVVAGPQQIVEKVAVAGYPSPHFSCSDTVKPFDGAPGSVVEIFPGVVVVVEELNDVVQRTELVSMRFDFDEHGRTLSLQ
jgi:hypothetical protein